MKYGLTEKAVGKISAVFARFPAIEKAVLYGSRAKGNFKAGSDIDLTLYGEAVTPDLRSAIASALDDLLLPYTIDLSVFDELDHAKLREHIERVGVLFYERANQGAVSEKGWETKPFESCIEPVDYTRKVQRKDFLSEGQFPIVSQEAEFTNGYWNDKTDVFKVSTPVVIFGDHTQVLKYVDFDFVLGADGVKILQPRNFLCPKFFFYQLQAAELPSLGYARHYRLLKELEIIVPPLAEQQRIVGLLDEAFTGLATAKANAEKNLQNARALFESRLQSVFTQRGKGWVEKSLGETCEMYQPKTIGTKDLVADGPYPVFGANGIIGRYDKFNHEEPQLLVTCRGATCGSVNVSQPKSWITGNAMVVRPLDHSLDLKFLEFVFRGGVDISKAITGAAQPQITRTNLSPLLIRFPKSVAEQTKLAEQFEDLAEETQRLASLYERKLAALEALKKSLLHQAFTGEL